MTVSPIRLQGWRGPGCGDGCLPRSHDPESHERFGYRRGQEDLRPRVVRTGPLVVDLNTRAVVVAGSQIVPPDAEWAMLAHLAEHLDAFCTTADLIAAMGGRSDLAAERNRVNVTVHRLKGHLGPAGHLIESGRKGRSGRRLAYVEPTP